MSAPRHAIVADVGGTNTRIAWVDADGVCASTVARFANDEFAGFADIVRRFLGGTPAPPDIAVAVAGMVHADHAQMTNRDWHITRAALGELGFAGAVHLVNDLAALGHALGRLPEDATELVKNGVAAAGGQQVVVGLGTGFNVSLVAGSAVLAAEAGQASVPERVAQVLRGAGLDVGAFPTAEGLFSGPGLERLHLALSGDAQAASVISKGENAVTRQTRSVMARAFGQHLCDLVYLYWPTGGVYINGSLGRVLLADPFRADVLGPLQSETWFSPAVAQTQVHLIRADTAALYGCAQVLG